ncbi:hypothetical protein CHLRE_02g078476v5 [Chlamydomonas reinhardtii]|uniref:Uncharacterized protein n=1 Tax=Chlamydomonas reinhardtii TaxID=3055 RepID=A0A2K3E0C7_CHLRE|nr:uncharacterized protein CHLRE_02g078476v5 [Chlamydomonas reinhardtii]PNW86242.1 hypothetical protein CHLRE_02g078476v5 [Chlamydomonas reinhardtii]
MFFLGAGKGGGGTRRRQQAQQQGCRWLGAVGALSLGWHARGAACAVHSSNAPVLAALLDARMATTDVGNLAAAATAASGGPVAPSGDAGGSSCAAPAGSGAAAAAQQATACLKHSH